ncbi:MAG: 50S ribosomal protein L40e [Candidatus Aenigmarchaeota archaeon]|nr:50S ribosomal protein L40e [Candidatus Aenigmarchaeota archaeon]
MPRQKFPEAEARLFRRVFVCMHCGAKLRADPAKIRLKKVKCRKCKRREFRPMKRGQKSGA